MKTEQWKKSSFCRTDTPMCTEVDGLDEDYVHVRNSRNPHTVVSFDRGEWLAFIDGVKAGDFDLKTAPELYAEEMMEQV